MRQNIKLNADELLLAQVRRAQELRKREVMPSEEDLEFFAYMAVFFVLITLIAVVVAVA